MNGGAKYRVRCWKCSWRGVRTDGQCECYDMWRLYCRAGSPGPGCPRGVVWPCLRCGPDVDDSFGFRNWSSVSVSGPVATRRAVPS